MPSASVSIWRDVRLVGAEASAPCPGYVGHLGDHHVAGIDERAAHPARAPVGRRSSPAYRSSRDRGHALDRRQQSRSTRDVSQSRPLGRPVLQRLGAGVLRHTRRSASTQTRPAGTPPPCRGGPPASEITSGRADHGHQVAHRRAAQALDLVPGGVELAVRIEAGRHGDTIMIGRASSWTCSSLRQGLGLAVAAGFVAAPPVAFGATAAYYGLDTGALDFAANGFVVAVAWIASAVELAVDAVWPGAQAGAKLVRRAVAGAWPSSSSPATRSPGRAWRSARWPRWRGHPCARPRRRREGRRRPAGHGADRGRRRPGLVRARRDSVHRLPMGVGRARFSRVRRRDREVRGAARPPLRLRRPSVRCPRS